MVSARSATAIVGFLVSLGLSIALWVWFGLPAFLVLIPFVPFLFRRDEPTEVRECPVCGFRTGDPSTVHGTATG